LASIPRISREPSEMVITGAAWTISESAAASTASRSVVACGSASPRPLTCDLPGA
jgi:hypothetical protein